MDEENTTHFALLHQRRRGGSRGTDFAARAEATIHRKRRREATQRQNRAEDEAAIEPRIIMETPHGTQRNNAKASTVEDGSKTTGREEKRQSTDGRRRLAAEFGESSNDIREVKDDNQPKIRLPVETRARSIITVTIRRAGGHVRGPERESKGRIYWQTKCQTSTDTKTNQTRLEKPGSGW